MRLCATAAGHSTFDTPRTHRLSLGRRSPPSWGGRRTGFRTTSHPTAAPARGCCCSASPTLARNHWLSACALVLPLRRGAGMRATTSSTRPSCGAADRFLHTQLGLRCVASSRCVGSRAWLVHGVYTILISPMLAPRPAPYRAIRAVWPSTHIPASDPFWNAAECSRRPVGRQCACIIVCGCAHLCSPRTWGRKLTDTDSLFVCLTHLH